MPAAARRTVKVVSYNLLAPTLCSADRFITANPRNLDPAVRWKKVRLGTSTHMRCGVDLLSPAFEHESAMRVPALL